MAKYNMAKLNCTLPRGNVKHDHHNKNWLQYGKALRRQG